MNLSSIPQRLTQKAILAGPSIVAWSNYRLERTMKRSRDAAEGFLNTGLSSAELEEFTLWCYQTNYHRTHGYSNELFEWERRNWNKFLGDSHKTLVLAAGRGREVAQLQSRQIEVWATEPDPTAFKACQTICGDHTRISDATFRDFAFKGRESWSDPDSIPVFDSVIIGWGSLSHCFGTALRRDLFRRIGELCPDGPILSSFWYQQNKNPTNRGRAYDAGAKIGRWARSLNSKGDDEHLECSFAPHLGVALLFTESELRELANVAEREVVELPMQGRYPNVVMLKSA